MDKVPGDPNAYSTCIMTFVLAYIPGMGKVGAATVENSYRASCPDSRLAPGWASMASLPVPLLDALFRLCPLKCAVDDRPAGVAGYPLIITQESVFCAAIIRLAACVLGLGCLALAVV